MAELAESALRPQINRTGVSGARHNHSAGAPACVTLYAQAVPRRPTCRNAARPGAARLLPVAACGPGRPARHPRRTAPVPHLAERTLRCPVWSHPAVFHRAAAPLRGTDGLDGLQKSVAEAAGGGEHARVATAASVAAVRTQPSSLRSSPMLTIEPVLPLPPPPVCSPRTCRPRWRRRPSKSSLLRWTSS
jgi:hypothetical protein